MLRSLFFTASRKQTDQRSVSLSCAVLQQKNFRTVENDRKPSPTRARGLFNGDHSPVLSWPRHSPHGSELLCQHTTRWRWDLARMERAKPVIGQRSSLATIAEELLLRHAYRRSYAHSEAGRIGRGLESPNLLCTRPDIYIESWPARD